VRDAFERIAEFGGDNMRVGVAGDSAGGNLAAAVAIDALQAAGVPTKRHQGAGLIYGYFGLGEASEAARLEAQRALADFKAMLERGA
jgi:acetyl esterase/lipase